jgi:hypothetical protein
MKMKKNYEFSNLKRLVTIYLFVQIFLLALLAYVGFGFQMKMRAIGRPDQFTKSALAALVLQLVLFYVINKFASSEASREVESSATGLKTDELAALRKKRLIGDFIKAGVFIFFVTFILRAPDVPLVQCTLFFTFILTFLTYFQCYNFAVKRLMKDKS